MMCPSPPCPLCSNSYISRFHQDNNRIYLHCNTCDLVFVHPDNYLTQAEEFNRYEFHNNDPEDSRYRAVLAKLFNPLADRLAPNSSGLDFGSGPGPLLKVMFEELGHHMSIYDAFYAPDSAVFTQQYDFVTASETAEHLHQPLKELNRLWGCLKPGGILGIMTGIRYDNIDFESWYYIRDETHVVFFSPKSFEWLAEYWGAKLDFVGDSVVLFQKNSEDADTTID